MAVEDRNRWNQKHAASADGETPSPFLQHILESHAWGIMPGKALDLASGKGRNAMLLATRGFDVTAIDISSVGLAEASRRARQRSLSIDWREWDLEEIELANDAYDMIVKINYLQRSLFTDIKRAIKPGGHVIIDTYLIDQKEIGHPSNPDFLLARNELLEHFRGFRVLLYREGKFADAGEAAFRAGILAQKPI